MFRGAQGYVRMVRMRDLTSWVLACTERWRRYLISLRIRLALSEDLMTCWAVKECEVM